MKKFSGRRGQAAHHRNMGSRQRLIGATLLDQDARDEDHAILARGREGRNAFPIFLVHVRTALTQEFDVVHGVVFAARVIEGGVAVVVGLVDTCLVLVQLDVAVLTRSVERRSTNLIGTVDVVRQ
eukprot:CAMPEP_0198652134 /NCGR_PEP_ID=MMETSP1467-20131203/6164_1 /TAXON_ID=1462469 /ORGANISM="unid. sp., Strain CCMP2135" /LENGTH=124 /DNA_ID=CAMNT_0044388039 /DNA_START=216 /DNA_END=591 /DNA_ORIENTATION=+